MSKVTGGPVKRFMHEKVPLIFILMGMCIALGVVFGSDILNFSDNWLLSVRSMFILLLILLASLSAIKSHLKNAMLIAAEVSAADRVPRSQVGVEFKLLETLRYQGIHSSLTVDFAGIPAFESNMVKRQLKQDSLSWFPTTFLFNKIFDATDNGRNNIADKNESPLITGGHTIEVSKLFRALSTHLAEVDQNYLDEVKKLGVERIRIHFPALNYTEDFQINPEPTS